jgi:hypothetical protein
MNNWVVVFGGLHSHGFQSVEYVSNKIDAGRASDCSGNQVRGPLPSSALEWKAQFTKQYCIA